MRIVPLKNGYINIGLQTWYGVRLEAPFEKARQLNCRRVEVFFDKHGQHGFDPMDLKQDARNYIRGSEMVVSVHAPIVDSSSPRAEALLGGALSFGHDVGADIVTFHTPGMVDEQSYVMLAGLCRSLAPNMRVALENTVECGSPAELDQAVTLLSVNLGAQAGVTFDVGHAAVASVDPASFLLGIRSPLFHLHLHDNAGREDRHLSPGQGEIDFQRVLSILGERNFEGAGILEYWRPHEFNRDIDYLQLMGQLAST